MARTTKRQKEYDALLKQHRKLARKADDRLRSLEKMAKLPGFKSVKEYAYKKAMKSIRYWSGENANRFSRKEPKRLDQLRAKIKDIERFLSFDSSLPSKIRMIYKKRADTINAKYGTSFKWETMGKFFESPEFQIYASEDGFGSDTYMYAIGELENNEKYILNQMKKNKPINLDIKDSAVNDAVSKLLEVHGKNFTKLYKRR